MRRRLVAKTSLSKAGATPPWAGVDDSGPGWVQAVNFQTFPMQKKDAKQLRKCCEKLRNAANVFFFHFST